jgi:hypothetical protein
VRAKNVPPLGSRNVRSWRGSKQTDGSNDHARLYQNGEQVKPLAELVSGECRFIVDYAETPGDRPGSAYVFCAEPAIAGRSYCACHASIVYVPYEQRNKADRALAKAA